MKTWLSVVAISALATLASATTISWTGVSVSNTGWGEIGTYGGSYPTQNIGQNASAAIKLTATFATQAPASGTLLCFGGKVGPDLNTNGAVGLRLEGGTFTPSVSEAVGSGIWTTLANPTLKTGSNEIVLAIERGAGSVIPATVAIFINGQKAFVFDGTITGLYFNAVWVGRGLGGAENDPWDVAPSEYTVGFAKGATIADVEELYKVPEPTALALLVLGGGLVLLKRRVA